MPQLYFGTSKLEKRKWQMVTTTLCNNCAQMKDDQSEYASQNQMRNTFEMR